MRGMRVDDIHMMVSNRAAKPPCRERIDLAHWIAVDDTQSDLDGPRSQRLPAPRSDNRHMSAARKRTGEPKRLTFAAAPAALRINVQHSQSHGAQLPSLDDWPQAQPTAARALT